MKRLYRIQKQYRHLATESISTLVTDIETWKGHGWSIEALEEVSERVEVKIGWPKDDILIKGENVAWTEQDRQDVEFILNQSPQMIEDFKRLEKIGGFNKLNHLIPPSVQRLITIFAA